ncbi:CCHC-type domain-containing protein [Trichonephila clavipes]|nr:CCHC-type domain-containing protein [Trichonephila clavipes]
MRSGDLFLEASSAKQATALINLQKLVHLDVTVAPYTNLNFSRGIISQADFLNVSTEEIKENTKAQKVCDVGRITIRRDGQVLNTNHLILTFSTPDLPQTVKMAYFRCLVRPYIPNPLRCFQCQRFGHSKTVCRGQITCSRCAEIGHDSADCKAKELSVNCKGNRSSFFRSCPTWILEKEILAVKIKNKISYPEAQRVVSSRTPVSGKSYASATSKIYVSTAIQVDASTATTSATAASITPKNIAVDTLKSVSPTRDVKKNKKTRIKDSGVQSHKKRCQTSLKNPMTWITMSWNFMHPKATKV